MSKTRPATAAGLRRERRKLLKELSGLSLLIRGSFFERFSTCARPNCACHKGKRHGPRAYLSVTRDQAQRQHYVPQRQIDAVRRGVRQHQRLLQIVERITAINLQLMREGALHERHT